ncbi:MAG: PfkB family carbohydrate kinase [Polyangiales bacterium]
MTPDLVCAGNLLVDDLVFDDGRTVMGQAGGALLHAALAAAHWGARVGAAGIAGTDYPAAALDALAAAGVSLDGVERLPGPGARIWLLYEGGARQMVHRLGRPSHAEVSPGPAHLPAAWREARALHVCPMPLACQRALVEASSRETLVGIDPHEPLSREGAAAWRAVLASCDALFVGADELRLAPGDDVFAAVEEVAGERLRFVAHKRGEAGGALLDRRTGQRWAWDAVPAETVDPTGAGDAFAAAFMAAWAAGCAVEERLARAAAAASVAVTARGAAGLAGAARAELEARRDRCRVRAG